MTEVRLSPGLLTPEQLAANRFRPMYVCRVAEGLWGWQCRLRCAAPYQTSVGLESPEVAGQFAAQHLVTWHEPAMCMVSGAGSCPVPGGAHFLWYPMAVFDTAGPGWVAHRWQWLSLVKPASYVRLSKGGLSHAS